MGRKSKHVTRTARGIARDKFPIGSLAQRRKELKVDLKIILPIQRKL